MNRSKKNSPKHGFIWILKLMLFVGMSMSACCTNLSEPVKLKDDNSTVPFSDQKPLNCGNNPHNNKEKTLENKLLFHKIVTLLTLLGLGAVVFKYIDSLQNSILNLQRDYLSGKQEQTNKLLELTNQYEKLRKKLQVFECNILMHEEKFKRNYLESESNTSFCELIKSWQDKTTLKGMLDREPEPLKEYRFNFYEPRAEKKGFAAVGGNMQALAYLRQAVESFQCAKHIKALGGTPLKGILLHGPPGTGKTMLVKALAEEVAIPVMIVKGSDLMDAFLGQSARNVKAMFDCARKKERCIIFIDEIEAILRKRGASNASTADEMGTIVTEFLQQMDGIESDNQVMLIFATNHLDMIDNAIMRSGRINQTIQVDYPDLESKRSIFEALKSTRFTSIDALTEEFLIKSLRKLQSGADIAEWLNKGAMKAGIARRSMILKEDLITS